MHRDNITIPPSLSGVAHSDSTRRLGRPHKNCKCSSCTAAIRSSTSCCRRGRHLRKPSRTESRPLQSRRSNTCSGRLPSRRRKSPLSREQPDKRSVRRFGQCARPKKASFGQVWVIRKIQSGQTRTVLKRNQSWRRGPVSDKLSDKLRQSQHMKHSISETGTFR